MPTAKNSRYELIFGDGSKRTFDSPDGNDSRLAIGVLDTASRPAGMSQLQLEHGFEIGLIPQRCELASRADTAQMREQHLLTLAVAETA